MNYRRDLWEIAAASHGVLTVRAAEDAGVPGVEVRKLASRGALTGYGQGVYSHREIPWSRYTQPMIAVSLGGEGAFLHREAVFDLLELGQFNPRSIRVGTNRRVRRSLPEWMVLEPRYDISNTQITMYERVPSTTVQQALKDVRTSMPSERWDVLIAQADHRELISPSGALELRGTA